MAAKDFTRVKPHTCITCGALFTPVKYRASEDVFKAFTGRQNCSKECLDAWKAKSKSAYMRANREKFSGPNSWNWKGACLLKNKSYRGSDWTEIAESIRKRDKYQCCDCGLTHQQHLDKWGKILEVHHKIPFHEFTDHRKANAKSNLVTLCKSCHMIADRAIRHRQLIMIFSDEPRKKSKEGIHRGSKNARAQLSESQVATIKKLLASGSKQTDLADVFSVKKTIISAISTGQNWSHVKAEA